MERQWYAIKTKPRKEFFAEQNFLAQGYTVFLPVTLRLRRHARRVEEVRSPLFSGYLFLELGEDEKNWIAIASTRGASGPVRFGNVYPPVPRWFIAGLKERINDDGIIMVGARHRYGFEPGDRVRYMKPNDTIIEGVLKTIEGKDRAIILVELLKREIEAAVPLSALRPA